MVRAFLLMFPLGGSAVGCVIIPIPQSTKAEGIRARLSGEQLVAIDPGVTSRRRSLLILGEPDQVLGIGSETYDCYVIRATRTDVLLGILIPPRGIGTTLRGGSREYLFVHSGREGLVKKYAIRTVLFNVNAGGGQDPHQSVRDMIEDWEAGKADVLEKPEKR